MIEKVTQALHEAVGAPKETIRVWIQEVPSTNWGIAGQTAKDLGR
ncbi:4-oxalocrotonate tautomerase [Sphaerotilus natans subsp. natans DSM 6575]|uniref:4-oxalocrotonate tautomerase n=1 Tax=Sphaerotilus natans subsp. natans DSM 6575 TaxID=1286631 RepID=A0A059KLC3_9BURK|nr:4-oxalocrotonate tautomerase [Sphaerotilus natans subsp. natans DSM 6575]